MAITPLPLPQPGDTNWAGPLNASLEQLNQDVGEISETGQDILDAAGVAQQSATDAEAARAVAVSAAGDAEGSREVAVAASGAAGAAEVAAVAALGGAETARTEAEAARDLALAGQYAGSAIQTSGVDVNTLTTPGVYRFSGAAATASLNMPPYMQGNRAGVLEVFSVNLSTNTTIQRFTQYLPGRGIYTRAIVSNEWSPWSLIPSQRIDTTAGYRVLTWDDVNNREQMIHGDTGWRNITALAGGAMTFTPPHGIWIRRVGDGVSIEIIGAYLSPSTIVSPPLGFRSSTRYLGRGTLARHAAPSLVAGVRMVSSVGALDISPVPGWTSGDVVSGTISYSTTDAWPTSLPGTPA